MHAFFAPLLGLVMFLVPGGGWLGVYLAADREEAVVTEVVPDSPAQKAGLRAGDVLLAVGDKATPTRDELIATIGAASPGDRVAIKVKRGGKETTVVVKLGKRPSEIAVAETAPPAAPRRGGRPAAPARESAPAREVAPVRGREVESPQAAAGGVFLGISVVEADGKLMIERVLDDSPAHAAGLKAGEQLEGIGRSRLRSLADLDKALAGLEAEKPVQVSLRGEDSRRSVQLVPARRAGTAVAIKVPKPARAAESARAEAEEEVAGEVVEEEPVRRRVVVRPLRPGKPAAGAQLPPSSAAAGGVDKELESLRRELQQLKKELQELRKQVRKQGGGK